MLRSILILTTCLTSVMIAVASTPPPATLPATQSAAVTATQPTVKLEILGIREERSSGSYAQRLPIGPKMPAISIQFRFSGEAIGSGIHGVKRINVVEARDDVGTDLRYKTPDNFYVASDFAGGSPLTAQLDLSSPVRRATSIKVLKGDVEFRVGGECHTVTIHDLKSHVGKPLVDPILEQAGVRMNFTHPARLYYELDVRGNSYDIGEVRLLNPSGVAIRLALSVRHSNDQGLIMLPAQTPVTDETRLEFDVWTGQKFVVLPFDARDVLLP